MLYARRFILIGAIAGCLGAIHGFTLVSAADGSTKAIKEPELAAELRRRFESDQAIRKEWIEFSTKHNIQGKEQELDELDPKVDEAYKALIKKVSDEDQSNQVWLKEVIQKHGWPGRSLVGAQGAHDAWLLVQHASKDLEFQQDCLAKMTAMPKGEVSSIDIAYLTDRILCLTGKKQKYGTQGMFKDGKIIPQPIEDEEHVDERRKELGFEPLADYLKMMEKAYGLAQTSETK
jgi:hypothetical protein